jgi:hypothetical protein
VGGSFGFAIRRVGIAFPVQGAKRMYQGIFLICRSFRHFGKEDERKRFVIAEKHVE